jgi:hypothetical protein
MIQIRPGQTFEAGVQGVPTGLVNTIGVRIIDTPGGATILARTTAGIAEQPPGSGYYTRAFAANEVPATGGTYSIVWDTGVVSPSTVWTEQLVVSEVAAAGGALLTRAQLKFALKDNTTANDSLYDQIIPMASQAVRDFAQREFKTPVDLVNSTRRYIYDGSGVLEIEDAHSIDSVTVVRNGVPDTEFTVNEYEPQPYRSVDSYQPYYWLDILPATGFSPEMGFTRNLDTLWTKYLLPNTAEVFVDVSASWGWASIPGTVTQAAIWTAASFLENPRNLISESVAGVSRSYANPSRSVALPERAKELLYDYQRMK